MDKLSLPAVDPALAAVAALCQAGRRVRLLASLDAGDPALGEAAAIIDSIVTHIECRLPPPPEPVFVVRVEGVETARVTGWAELCRRFGLRVATARNYVSRGRDASWGPGVEVERLSVGSEATRRRRRRW